MISKRLHPASFSNVNTQLAQIGKGARVYNSAAVSIANSTSVVLPFDSEHFDTNVCHDTVTNNSRLTCKSAGKYLIIGNVEFAISAVGSTRIASILLNGATRIARVSTVPNASTPKLNVSTIYTLAVNDYVELQVFQDSGGALNVHMESAHTPQFMMVKVG